MNINNTSRFILHVSDFHLTDNDDEIAYAQDALKALSDKLSSEKIKVDYLVHTGDVINSSDLYEKTAQKLKLDKSFFLAKKIARNYFLTKKSLVRKPLRRKKKILILH